MSKDIWHFPSEAPAYCFLCVFENSFDGEVHCGHYNPVKKQFCSTEGRYEINQVKKYCDLLHLLDCEQELIRTRKALEIAVDALKEQQRWLGIIRISMVSHLNNEKGTVFQPYDADPTVLNIGKAKVLLNNALEQITALEQKEVK